MDLQSLVLNVATVGIEWSISLIGTGLLNAAGNELFDHRFLFFGGALAQFFNGSFLIEITAGVEQTGFLEEASGEGLDGEEKQMVMDG